MIGSGHRMSSNLQVLRPRPKSTNNKQASSFLQNSMGKPGKHRNLDHQQPEFCATIFYNIHSCLSAFFRIPGVLESGWRRSLGGGNSGRTGLASQVRRTCGCSASKGCLPAHAATPQRLPARLPGSTAVAGPEGAAAETSPLWTALSFRRQGTRSARMQFAASGHGQSQETCGVCSRLCLPGACAGLLSVAPLGEWPARYPVCCLGVAAVFF